MSNGKHKNEDFWIGDKVILLKSQRIGIFMGASTDNKIKVNINGKTVLTNFNNIKMVEEEEYKFPEWLFEGTDENTKGQIKSLKPNINSVIDLHIEVLKPELKNSKSKRILDYQIGKCKEFIEQSIQSKLPIITIVCGKGEGILRESVKHTLNGDKNVKFVIEKNDGGALEVWFT